ncbi:hypothetical protein DER29_0502 [Micromonospora sp. M71_S20]|nr:hypothetical protein DER29_0502 [Micromonospora sp. M71_S20]
MPPRKYAPPRESDGLKPYVLRYRSFTFTSNRIVWAASLKDAQQFTYTRERFASYTVRRATPADMEAHA